MKVCFLILAHHQPAIFARLIRQVSSAETDVIVHVDRRSDTSEFAAANRNNVRFINRRNRVHWAGWSLTKTLCETLEFGLEHSDADYFMYLAGTDLPIRPVRDLTALLDRSYPANYLNFYPIVPGVWGFGLIDRYRFVDFKARVLGRQRNDGRASPGLRTLFHHGIERLETRLNRMLPKRDTSWMDFYSGSSRWCLARETAQHVAESFRSPRFRRLRRYLRYCANSDEIFVQSVVLNSSHRNSCIGYDEQEARAIFNRERAPMADERRVYLHYVDWSPEREDPAILDETDFERLRDSGKYFACKFAEDRSMQLAERIEAELLTPASGELTASPDAVTAGIA